MACDRFVNFPEGTPVPSKDDLQKAIEDYLGGAAIKVEWKGDRFFANLHGKGSNPFQRLVTWKIVEDEERWLEVHVGSDNVDVITRRMDEYTNAVACGLAKLIARYWKGSFQEEG